MRVEEGRVEVLPQILQIYPLGGDVVRIAARPLLQDPGEYLMLAEPMQDDENTYANGYLLSLSENLKGEGKIGFRLGIALAYDVLKVKFGKQKIPVLNLEYVQTYDMYMSDRFRKVYAGSRKKQAEGAFEEELIKRGVFAIIEKEAYQVLDDELTDKDESIFENNVYLGFITSYFLYKRGLEDRRHWEQDK